MNVREKLIGLIAKAKYICANDYSDHTEDEYIADTLLDNGVTVQEWIPASEPPKKYRDEYGGLIPFLVCEEGTDYPFRAMYDGKTWGDGVFAIHVKWWMPLPQPAEGE